MFNSDFYPTPKSISAKMLKGLVLDTKSSVLEPHGGKGDLCRAIYSHTGIPVDTIEIDVELQSFLRGCVEARVVDYDFLEFVPEVPYTHIIMNPPFRNGVQHLRHAIDIADGTEIRCLLSKDSLSKTDPDTLNLGLRLRDLGAVVDDLGSCFVSAERKTKVEVVLVSVTVPEIATGSFDFDPYFDQEQEVDLSSGMSQNALANPDVFQDFEDRYTLARRSYAEVLRHGNAFWHYAKSILSDKPKEEEALECTSGGRSDFKVFADKLRHRSWLNLFESTKLQDLLTSTVKKKFMTMQQKQGAVSFTKRNMELLFKDLYQNKDSIMSDCVLESFDKLTNFYSTNTNHKEGWKTNKRYRVNFKVIVPWGCHNSKDFSDPYLREDTRGDLVDVEKGLCFLTGKSWSKIYGILSLLSDSNSKREADRDLRSAKYRYKELKKRRGDEVRKTEAEFLAEYLDRVEKLKDVPLVTWGTWYTTEFFQVKFFKKGTIHLQFVSKSVWDQFNKAVADGKGWVGGEDS